MQRKKILGGVLAATTAALLVAAGVAVSAVSAAPAVDEPTTITLPLFGVPLTVDLSTGAGGVLTNVSVNPADGFTATQVKPNRVNFVNADGTAELAVRGRDGRQSVAVRAGALGDISGLGSWSGDVFDAGVITDVSFIIGATLDGGPDITGVTTTDPSAEIGGTEYKTEDDDGELSQRASVKITFTVDGQQRTLKINVKVETEDGVTEAKVGVTLGKLRGVFQPAADAAGTQTWAGLLCDGSAASIAYTINMDGSIIDVIVSPGTAVVESVGRKVNVRFSDDERVKILSVSNTDGIKVSIKEKIRCRDAADPTMNTPMGESSDDDDEQKDREHNDAERKDGKDKDGEHDGSGDDD